MHSVPLLCLHNRDGYSKCYRVKKWLTGSNLLESTVLEYFNERSYQNSHSQDDGEETDVLHIDHHLHSERKMTEMNPQK